MKKKWAPLMGIFQHSYTHVSYRLETCLPILVPLLSLLAPQSVS